MNKIFKSGEWCVEYIADDGGRISRLQYSGIDLLTRKPEAFIKPEKDFGLYETRPVYGYDDCFPTVDSCRYPDSEWIIPDHGELCWLPWNIKEHENQLICSVSSRTLPLTFHRDLHFKENELAWNFCVDNHGEEPLCFLHVMHALMPLELVSDIVLPEFDELYDETDDSSLFNFSTEKLTTQLLNHAKGSASMFILRDIKKNQFSLTMETGLKLTVTFPVDIFPSLGIWWNNSGYPDEKNYQRNECAFEPIPGNCSILEKVFNEVAALKVKPGTSFSWCINWNVLL